MRVVLYGSRPDGHAKVVADLATCDPRLEVVGLIDDFAENAGRTVRGLTVLGTGEDLILLREREDLDALLLGFGESHGRAMISERAVAAGYELPRLIHPSAQVCTSAVLGDGCQVFALVYIAPDARVGSAVLVNTSAVIEHDVTLDDGVVVGPAATLCGRVHVGTEANVGAGATVLPDVTVGDRAIIAAGALVRENVVADTVVAGVPARLLDRSSPAKPE
jgi:sugar O-acyltransferase (sialic acid O-acetyltransferase NeuD family)